MKIGRETVPVDARRPSARQDAGPRSSFGADMDGPTAGPDHATGLCSLDRAGGGLSTNGTGPVARIEMALRITHGVSGRATRGPLFSRDGVSRPRALPHHVPQERRDPHQVASPHATGIHRQAVDPLDSQAAHPAGRPADAAGMEVECGPHADERGGGAAPLVAVHPDLLLGRPQPHPDDVGARGVDLLDEGGFLVLAERAEGGQQVPAIRIPGKRSTRRAASRSATPGRPPQRKCRKPRGRPRSQTSSISAGPGTRVMPLWPSILAARAMPAPSGSVSAAPRVAARMCASCCASITLCGLASTTYRR